MRSVFDRKSETLAAYCPLVPLAGLKLHSENEHKMWPNSELDLYENKGINRENIETVVNLVQWLDSWCNK